MIMNGREESAYQVHHFSNGKLGKRVKGRCEFKDFGLSPDQFPKFKNKYVSQLTVFQKEKDHIVIATTNAPCNTTERYASDVGQFEDAGFTIVDRK